VEKTTELMTTKAEHKTDKPPITRRFIACTQSTGRVGKSTFAEGLISWLRFAGVTFAAIDGDNQHQTLARRYPNDVDAFGATKSTDDFAKMIQALPPTPVGHHCGPAGPGDGIPLACVGTVATAGLP
jgi:adenylylsulfate kinase-like enzyme